MGRTSKQDDSLSSLSLEDIKKREVECNDDFHNLMYELSQLVERVRQIFGYSRVKFAQLLGLSVFQYYRFIDPTPDNCNPYVLAIYRFCYIFGYDLQSQQKQRIMRCWNSQPTSVMSRIQTWNTSLMSSRSLMICITPSKTRSLPASLHTCRSAKKSRMRLMEESKTWNGPHQKPSLPIPMTPPIAIR